MLGCIEAIKYFLIYLDGRQFTLETDHRALEYLLSARLTNKRLIRWALQLQGLSFTIRHRSSVKNANADGLSRQAWTFTEEELRFQGQGMSPVIQQPEKPSVPSVGDVGWPEATPVSSETPRLVSWVPESEAGAVALPCEKKCRPVPFLS